MIVVGIAVAVAWVVAVRGPHPVAVGATLVAGGIHPALGAALLGGVVGVTRLRRISMQRKVAAERRSEELVGVDLVAHGVAAGVSFGQAVEIAARFTVRGVDTRLRRCLRMSRTGWEPPRDGTPIESMFLLARASASSGAPLAGQLLRLSQQHQELDETAQRERLERLPVKLLFPLAFLILPGFLLVAVVPAVAGGLMKLTL